MRRILSVILGLALLVWILGPTPRVWATVITDLYFDLGTSFDATDSDSLTSPFTIFDLESYYAFDFSGVTSLAEISLGTQVTYFGHAIAQELQDVNKSGVSDQENMVTQAAANSDDSIDGDWEITMVWDNFTGYVTEVIPNIYYQVQYAPGGTLSLLVDLSPDANENGTASDPTDDYGFGADDDTTLILQAELLSGESRIVNTPLGPGHLTLLNLRIVAINDFSVTPYMDSYTYDLDSLLGQNFLLTAMTDAGAYGQGYWEASLDLNDLIFKGQGEATLQIDPIPEPASLLLVGTGLFLTGFVFRRQLKKIKA